MPHLCVYFVVKNVPVYTLFWANIFANQNLIPNLKKNRKTFDLRTPQDRQKSTKAYSWGKATVGLSGRKALSAQGLTLGAESADRGRPRWGEQRRQSRSEGSVVVLLTKKIWTENGKNCRPVLE